MQSFTVALDIFFFVLGGGLIYFGAEWLVAGASSLAAALGVRPLLIGLTVVAYGTSAPELAVSVTAAFDNQGAIALGNVLGSNIANLGLVLGLTALISPPAVPPGLWRSELPWLCAATLILPALMLDGTLSRVEGAGLFVSSIVFTVALVVASRRRRRTARSVEAQRMEALAEGLVERAEHETNRAEREAAHSPDRALPTRVAALILGGFFALSLGGKGFVTGASGLARELGIEERVVGLTVVALGTSLPELSASVVAAIRGHSEMAVGNVVGSNLFNLLLILGATALTRPLGVNLPALQTELWAVGGITLLGVIVMRRERLISRLEGFLFVSGYGAFLTLLVTRG